MVNFLCGHFNQLHICAINSTHNAYPLCVSFPDFCFSVTDMFILFNTKIINKVEIHFLQF